MASAPPNGSVLATSDPARLTISARVWVMPGSAPVIVKVTAISALSCSSGQQREGAGMQPAERLDDLRPADAGHLGQAPDQQATASAMETTSRATRHHTLLLPPPGRA